MLASVFVSAQDKKGFRLSSLPENATIAETQEWLTAALTQNSSYLSKNIQQLKDLGSRSASNETTYTDSKISEVKFQGPVLTYKLFRSMQINSSGVKTGMQSGNSSPSIPEETTATVQVNLKDINPEEITLQEIDPDSKLQQLSLRTLDYKRVIRLKSPDTGTVNISVANFVIVGHIGEQVQAAFIHLVKLVQEQKP
jgi:hypothetical protein